MRGISRHPALSLLVILLPALVSCDRPEKKWISDTTGISFVIPGDRDWKSMPPQGASKLVLRCDDPHGVVAYQEVPTNHPVHITQKTGEAFEARMLKLSHGTKVAGQMITFHGRPAYEYEETYSARGVEARTKTIVWSIGNTTFTIMAMKADKSDVPDDPLQDPFIKKFVGSIQLPDSSHQ
jgi:hypothetical protein